MKRVLLYFVVLCMLGGGALAQTTQTFARPVRFTKFTTNLTPIASEKVVVLDANGLMGVSPKSIISPTNSFIGYTNNFTKVEPILNGDSVSFLVSDYITSITYTNPTQSDLDNIIPKNIPVGATLTLLYNSNLGTNNDLSFSGFSGRGDLIITGSSVYTNRAGVANNIRISLNGNNNRIIFSNNTVNLQVRNLSFVAGSFNSFNGLITITDCKSFYSQYCNYELLSRIGESAIIRASNPSGYIKFENCRFKSTDIGTTYYTRRGFWLSGQTKVRTRTCMFESEDLNGPFNNILQQYLVFEQSDLLEEASYINFDDSGSYVIDPLSSLHGSRVNCTRVTGGSRTGSFVWN